MNIQEKLFELQDMTYKSFHQKLMPTVSEEAVIGVRVPDLRKLAKELFKNGEGAEFIKALPHTYYEENNLHAFIIEQTRDFKTVLSETNRFLPYIDNWATCDCFRPKIFAKHKDELYPEILKWLKSPHTYTVRYGIGMLLTHFLDEDFRKEHLEIVSEIKSDEYYINMMRAWYFATALAKQQGETLPYITENRLDAWTHNKAIQKAVESYRITNETKGFLKQFKII